jgi:transaldolase
MDRAEAEAIAVERPITASDLRVKVFADGADLDAIRSLYADPLITGFTTNPTLMRKAGISDYASFARAALEIVSDRPISFEVFSDEPAEMERQALKIASWGENVYVKIPVTNTSGIATDDLLGRLSDAGVKLNVTGMMTLSQVERVLPHIDGGPSAVVSVFAGRIADTGVDPIPIMTAALELLSSSSNVELLWASPREVLNIVQADQIGCHVITVTHDLLKKLPLLGHDLDDFSLETVKMFHHDARAAGYTL